MTPPDPARRGRRSLPRLGDLLLVGFSRHGRRGQRGARSAAVRCARRRRAALRAQRRRCRTRSRRLTRWIADAGAGVRRTPAADRGGRRGRTGHAPGPDRRLPGPLSHQELGDANDLALTELEARRIGAHAARRPASPGTWRPVVDVGLQPRQPGHRRQRAELRRRPGARHRARARLHGRHARGRRAHRAEALPRSRLELRPTRTWASWT